MAFVIKLNILPVGSNDAEVSRLRGELERLELSTQETMLAQQSKHGSELSSVREQLDEAERRNRAFEMDLQALREKVDKARIDSLQVNGNF